MTVYKSKKILKRRDVKLLSMTSMSALLASCNLLSIDPHYEYTGTSGDDEIVAKSGELEIFYSSLGADKLTGTGHSIMDYSDAPEAIKVYLDGVTAGEGGHAEGDILTGMGVLKGSAFDDYIEGNGRSSASYEGLHGNGGNDVLVGTEVDDNLHGDAGNDKLYGKADDDNLSGGDGQDELYGDAGNDTLAGNNGIDKLFGGDGDDLLSGGAGADIIEGGAGDDILSYGGANYYSATYTSSEVGVKVNLTTQTSSGGDADGDVFTSIEGIAGSNFDDELTGDGGNNYISGAKGNDKIYGLAGNDDLHGNEGDDLILGGEGNDVIYGGGGDDDLNGEAGNDIIYAQYFDDYSDGVRTGNVSVDIVNGGSGIDVLKQEKSDFDRVDGKLVEIVRSVEFIIQKAEHKIAFNQADYIDVLDSIETITLFGIREYSEVETIDVKDLWTELAVAEQAKFADEVEFLSWLGDDAGYNYEGL